jgi:hypothetical protein
MASKEGHLQDASSAEPRTSFYVIEASHLKWYAAADKMVQEGLLDLTTCKFEATETLIVNTACRSSLSVTVVDTLQATSCEDATAWTSALNDAGRREILVTKLDGSEFKVDVRTADVVAEIKQAIAKQQGVVVGQQILQLADQELPFDDSADVPWKNDPDSLNKPYYLQLHSELEPFTFNATSKYNTDYHCEISCVSFHQIPDSENFQSALRVHFTVFGDMSFGKLQDPLLSKLHIATSKEGQQLLPCTDHAFPEYDDEKKIAGWMQVRCITISALHNHISPLRRATASPSPFSVPILPPSHML